MPKIFIVVLLSMVISSVWLSLSMYTPSLPEMALSFGVSQNVIQLIPALFGIGGAIGALIFGPLSDHYGRAPVIKAGCFIFALASIVTAMTDNMGIFITARFFAGFGGSVSGVVGFAAVKDLYDEKDAIKIMALQGTLLTAIPILAPALGGYVDVYLGWQWTFIILAIFGVISYGLVQAFFPETLVRKPTGSFHVMKSFHSYRTLLTHRPYLCVVLLIPLLYAAEFAYLAITPFYFIEILGCKPDLFGIYLGFIAIAYGLGSFMTSVLAKRLTQNQLLKIGLWISCISCVGTSVIHFTFPMHVLSIVAVLFTFTFGIGVIFSPSTMGSLQFFDHIRGSASAVRSMLAFLFVGIGGFAASFLRDDTLLDLSLFMLGCSVVALVLFYHQANRQKH